MATLKRTPTPRRQWTPEEDVVMRSLYPICTAAQVAQELDRTKASVFQRARLLGLEKSEAFLRSDLSGRIQRGKTNASIAATQFKKGQQPWNAGTKGIAGTHPNSRKTQFRKGHKAGVALAKEQPIGAERIAEGVLQRKVNNDLPFQRRWRSVHALVWEAAHGPIPPGHKVIFKPGMHTTVTAEITPEKLELVSNAELMRRNSFHNRYPKEVGLLIQMKGQLTRRINRKTEELNEKQDR